MAGGIIAAAVALALLGLMCWLFVNAPTGFEDADGYHDGEPRP